MSTDNRQMNLNLFIYPNGHHEAAWRHPASTPERGTDIEYFQDLAKQAEAARFDALFFADSRTMANDLKFGLRNRFEPITWLSAIAAVTQRIGLIATASTTYSEPYNLARLFSSLDHLSRGRAGWNIVTTSAAAASANYGITEHPPLTERYARAQEFVDVTTRLWDSWEDDALTLDKAAGVYANENKVHDIAHHGAYFNVEGALTLPRSPQGRPVYVQAGGSEDGRDFAARHAEVIFTAHQSLDSALEFANDIRQRARKFGRDPTQVKILPGINPFIGETPALAQQSFDELNQLINPHLSLLQLKRLLGADLSGCNLDEPIPPNLIDFNGPQSQTSRFKLVAGIVEKDNPTLRELIIRIAGARGHWVPIGTPEQIADLMQQWFEVGAADGFNLMPPLLPSGLGDFVRQVLPILRARGLFRAEYTGTTLRDHLGLHRPSSVFAVE